MECFQYFRKHGTLNALQVAVEHDSAPRSRAGKTVQEWCAAYNLVPTARFDTGLYEEDGAITLAKTWCHKMDYFYTTYTAQKDDRYVFTQADVDGWEAPKAFTALVGRLGKKALVRTRELEKMRPRL